MITIKMADAKGEIKAEIPAFLRFVDEADEIGPIAAMYMAEYEHYKRCQAAGLVGSAQIDGPIKRDLVPAVLKWDKDFRDFRPEILWNEPHIPNTAEKTHTALVEFIDTARNVITKHWQIDLHFSDEYSAKKWVSWDLGRSNQYTQIKGDRIRSTLYAENWPFHYSPYVYREILKRGKINP